MSACDCNYHDNARGPKRGTLARVAERREAARRVAEAARGEIERYYSQQKASDAATATQMQDDFKRKTREFKERQGESQMLETLYQSERQRVLNTIRADEEERMGSVLAKKAQEKQRQEKEIQRLREQSNELRGLADKIKTARINKERADQLVEKQTLRNQAAEYDRALNQYLEQNDAAAVAKEAANQAQRRDNAVQARLMLEDQMAEKQEAIRQAELEHQRERMMIDEVVQRIMQEDVAEHTSKRAKQEDTKKYIEQFLRQQDDLKRKAEEAAAKEDRKIQEYWQMVRERESAEAERQAIRKEAADRMYEKVKREMEMEMRRREEEEELINMLQQEELEAKRRAEDEGRKLKAERAKADMIAANQHQMRLKAEREEAFKREEEEFRQRMMAKFAEDDRLEQMNAQKRRLRLAEHSREVQRMVDDKRHQYEAAKAREEAAAAAERAEQNRQQVIVEEERKKLLREAAELHEYLPKGVLRDKEDLEFIEKVLAEMAIHRGKA